MLNTARVACIALTAALTIGTIPAAAAGELSSTASSGGFTFTVVIPPIGEALRAARSGAVGLWTVSGGDQGLMLKFDDEDGNATLSLFHRRAVAARVSINGQAIEAENQSSGFGAYGLAADVYRFDSAHSAADIVTIAGI